MKSGCIEASLTLICSLLSISWLRPNQATTTKPNIGNVVFTKVPLVHDGLEASIVIATVSTTIQGPSSIKSNRAADPEQDRKIVMLRRSARKVC